MKGTFYILASQHESQGKEREKKREKKTHWWPKMLHLHAPDHHED
jgi:hypothetical protein